jgi:hypothetical protein
MTTGVTDPKYLDGVLFLVRVASIEMDLFRRKKYR